MLEYSGLPVFLLIFPSRALYRISAYLSVSGQVAGSMILTPVKSTPGAAFFDSSSLPIKIILAIPSFTMRLAASTTRLSSPSHRTIVLPRVFAFFSSSSTKAILKPSLK